MNLKRLVRKTDPDDFLAGPVLTVTAASPHEENGPILTSLPLVNCVDRLGTFIKLRWLSTVSDTF